MRIARLDLRIIDRQRHPGRSNSHLFAGTLRENLLMARPDATDGDLWSALDAARIAEFIRADPRGLDLRIDQARRTYRAVNVSASPSLGRSCAVVPSMCSMRRPVASTWKARP